MQEKTCAVCGKEFMANTGNQIYCSPTCQRRACRVRYRERHPNPAAGLVRTKCLWCGKEMEGPPPGKRYCSANCGYYYRRKYGANRPTRTTIYLVHKYTAEGMPRPMVGKVLSLPPELVERCLNTPLTGEEAVLIRQYYAPFRRRSKCG